MTDILLFDTPDGGEIEVIGGRPTLTDDLRSAAYLSHFGGNERDSGSDGDLPLEWWGNKLEANPARRYRSEFQFLLKTLPMVPSNLKRFEDAASSDLAWMLDENVVTAVQVRCRITAPKTLELLERIEINGVVVPIKFELKKAS